MAIYAGAMGKPPTRTRTGLAMQTSGDVYIKEGCDSSSNLTFMCESSQPRYFPILWRNFYKNEHQLLSRTSSLTTCIKHTLLFISLHRHPLDPRMDPSTPTPDPCWIPVGLFYPAKLPASRYRCSPQSVMQNRSHVHCVGAQGYASVLAMNVISSLYRAVR